MSKYTSISIEMAYNALTVLIKPLFFYDLNVLIEYNLFQACDVLLYLT